MHATIIRASLCLALLSGGTGAIANDWPFWRGPEQTGMARERAPVRQWSPEGENLLWKADQGGRSTPIVMKERLYAVGPVGEGSCSQERVFCLNAKSGDLVWEHRFNVFHTDIVENRVGWTSVCGDYETGNVYAHGTGGELFCFSDDGKIRWKVSMTEVFGRISGYGGRLHTPIVDEDRVIVSYLSSSWGPFARPLHRYVAFDKHNGDVLWWAAPGGKPLDTTYAAPIVHIIGGKRLLVAANADGNLYAMLARTGEPVWSFKLSKRGLNSSPVADGKYVYVTHSEENYHTTQMGGVICLDATGQGDITDSGVVWRRDGITAGYSSPAVAYERLFVVTNSSNLLCLNAKTGETVWEQNVGRVGKGSPIVTAEGTVFYGEQNGNFYIVRDRGDHAIVTDTDTLPGPGGLVNEIFGSPVIAEGRLFFMTRYGTYCVGKADALMTRKGFALVPPEVADTSTGGGMTQVVPAEVTVAPGETMRFAAYEFNPSATKRFERKQVTWRVKGPQGQISGDGAFTAASDAAFSAGVVIAEWDGKQAKARVRVSPGLPFTEDFESYEAGKIPPGWIGVAKKTEVVERDGGKVFCKLASKKFPSPPFMRLRSYVTPPIAGGYTVECDLLGTLKKRRFKPEMGLINSRYRMVAVGMEKTLRIESWSPVPRVRMDVPFEYLPDRWYTMKLEVKHRDDGTAVIRGKIWLRDESEPAGWMIEVADPCPNLEGSAGLYAYSTNTTAKSDGPLVFFDNLKVSADD